MTPTSSKLIKEQIDKLQEVYTALQDHSQTDEEYNTDVGMLLEEQSLDVYKVIRRLQMILICK